MGHQIHQMYTARRIQRYEQLYGWRPLKFRIEAFVNGFVDLVCIRSVSRYPYGRVRSTSEFRPYLDNLDLTLVYLPFFVVDSQRPLARCHDEDSALSEQFEIVLPL